MRTIGTGVALRALALTFAAILVAAAAQDANAWGRHNRSRIPRRAKDGHSGTGGTPLQIPVMDGDLGRADVDNQLAMQQIAAIQAHTLSTGVGVTIGVVDGGFDLRHEALAGHLVPGWDCIDEDNDAQDLGNAIDDDNDGRTDALVGHGTFVSSLLLAVAPNVQIIPIRVLNDESWGTEEDLIDGINFAVSHGARVLNMSLVIPDSSWMLRQALRAAADQGVIVVGSGGYIGGWQDDPMLANRVFAVGSVDFTNKLLSWSPTGWNIDCYAPGANIIGALGGTVPNSYAYWNGSSFSAPMTSGAAALIVSNEPVLTPLQVVNRIRNTVQPSINVWPLNRGRIDIEDALQQN